MTEKDFELLAKMVRELYLDQKTKVYIAGYFANMLIKKYPRFKKDLFITKCTEL